MLPVFSFFGLADTQREDEFLFQSIAPSILCAIDELVNYARLAEIDLSGVSITPEITE